MNWNQPGPVPAEKPAMVAGISRMELAKIGGITPDVLIFSGMCVESPPNIRVPTWRLGYCTTMRRCARSMNTMNADHEHRQHHEADDEERRQRTGAAQVEQCGHRVRQIGDDAGHDDQAACRCRRRAR